MLPMAQRLPWHVDNDCWIVNVEADMLEDMQLNVRCMAGILMGITVMLTRLHGGLAGFVPPMRQKAGALVRSPFLAAKICFRLGRVRLALMSEQRVWTLPWSQSCSTHVPSSCSQHLCVCGLCAQRVQVTQASNKTCYFSCCNRSGTHLMCQPLEE